VPVIDYFAFAGEYPFGPPGAFPLPELLRSMDRSGIDLCYVTGLASVFAKEPTAANWEFVADCASHADRLRPLPVIDLSLNVFEDDIRRLVEAFSIAGVRLQPNYHDYRIEPGQAERLMAVLGELDLALFLAREIEDLRFQPRCFGVEALTAADLAPLLACARTTPVVLNAFGAPEVMALAEDAGPNVFFDVSGFTGSFYEMERLARSEVGAQLVFGSHMPFLSDGTTRFNLEHSLLTPGEVGRILAGPGAPIGRGEPRP
jgi:predicted TIM-barrel fold metal-dependent hydrolase